MIVISSGKIHKRKNFCRKIVNIKKLVKQTRQKRRPRQTLTKRSKNILKNLGYSLK